MTKAQIARRRCARVERELKALGVHKPYMTLGDWVYRDTVALGQNFEVESYPLTARAKAEYSAEVGACYRITVSDCSLPRIGQDAKVAERVLDACSNLVRPIAEILTHLHAEAYTRAKAQEAAAMSRCMVAR